MHVRRVLALLLVCLMAVPAFAQNCPMTAAQSGGAEAVHGVDGAHHGHQSEAPGKHPAGHTDSHCVMMTCASALLPATGVQATAPARPVLRNPVLPASLYTSPLLPFDTPPPRLRT